MPILDTINQFIENSDISKAFNLDVSSFSILILGSFIVGYICLTFYYKIYYVNSNEEWNKLNFSEKSILSLVTGFLSILFSQYVLTIYQLPFINNKNLEQYFLQLKYIFPFFYFILFSGITAKYNYVKMEFIKDYIKVSVILIIISNFIFLFILLYINKSWGGILWLLVYVILLIIALCILRCIKKSSKSNLEA